MLLIEDQLPAVKGDPQAVADLIAHCMRTLYAGLCSPAGD
jgi:hypothetical protein